jgi:8-oxo-dGTP diphosphatase
MTAKIIALVFRAHVVDGRSKQTSEATWLTPDEIRTRMTEAFAVRLLDALDSTAPAPHIRVHDGRNLVA